MSKLHFFYGTMSAGKSVQLIQTHYTSTKSGIRTIAIKPELDNRFSENKIVSRMGIECPAQPLVSIKVDYILCSFPDVRRILVDEAQFFTPDSIESLVTLADVHGKTIMCYGLMVDSDGTMFPGAKKLIESGAVLHQLRTSCQIQNCESLATHHLRFDSNGNIIRKGAQICIGDDIYMSVCRPHFYEKYHGQKIKE
ncbi:MAG: thymidine kinase [Alphaproteobacteria bacterium]|nr:thymidine kinase [Alphaproteobacteria bacterium]